MEEYKDKFLVDITDYESTQWIVTIREEKFKEAMQLLLSIEKDFKKIIFVEVKDEIRISIKFKQLKTFKEIRELFKGYCHVERIKFDFEKIIYFDS